MTDEEKIIPLDTENFYNPYPSVSRFSTIDILLSTGGRGIGKTYSWKFIAVSNFIKKGEHFFYFRRTDAELDSIDELFSDMYLNFPFYQFKVLKNKFYIKRPNGKDWEKFGFYRSICSLKNFKGSNFPLVSLILLDEFQIDTEDRVTDRYRPGEYKKLVKAYESIARERPVKLVLLSNAESMHNPYFSGLGVNYGSLNDGYNIGKKGEATYCVEIIPPNETIKERKKKTRSFRLSTTIAEDKVSLENKFRDDDESRTKRPPENGFPVCNVKVNGVLYGCEQYEGDMYFSKRFFSGSPTYVMEKKDIADDCEFVTSYTANFRLRAIRSLFRKGQVWYNSKKTRFAIESFFEKTNIL